MQPSAPTPIFNQNHAAQYDTRFAKLAAMKDALHLLVDAVFAELPADARVLCVGAGTGAELVYLAAKHPGWHFTAVEPSAPMLEVCRSKVEVAGIADRCTFHEGYLDLLPPSSPFDGATSLLVSQFLLDKTARSAFFRAIAERLVPGGLLANADLASGASEAEYEALLAVWMQLMRAADMSAQQIENMRVAYGRDVAVLPVEEISALIESGGFTKPTLFLQTALIHAWYARRAPV